MKFFKATILLFSITFLLNCTTKIEGTSDLQPDFKIGRKAFETNLKKEFEFDKLSIGTYYTKKNYISEERGLNLTFNTSNVASISLSDVGNYATFIQNQTKENLLNLDNYDYVNITFTNETEENGIKRSTSFKLKKEL